MTNTTKPAGFAAYLFATDTKPHRAVGGTFECFIDAARAIKAIGATCHSMVPRRTLFGVSPCYPVWATVADADSGANPVGEIVELSIR